MCNIVTQQHGRLKMKVREEIVLHSEEADRPVLLWLLSKYSWSS